MTSYRVELRFSVIVDSDGTPEALEEAERKIRDGEGLMFFGLAKRADQSEEETK